MHFIEVTRDKGGKAWILADAVDYVAENPFKDARGNLIASLMIRSGNITLVIVEETKTSFFEKLKAARGGAIPIRIFSNENLSVENRPPPLPVDFTAPEANGVTQLPAAPSAKRKAAGA